MNDKFKFKVKVFKHSKNTNKNRLIIFTSGDKNVSKFLTEWVITVFSGQQ